MASTYQMVSYGSSGDSVRQLQQALNMQGYSLDVDGVFGSKTRSAVRSYQKKNNLRVDGIVGSETWGSLMAPAADTGDAVDKTPGVSAETAASLAKLEKGYAPSQWVSDALTAINELQQAQPESYQSQFQSQLESLYSQLVEREGFSYNPVQDAAYVSYAKQYAAAGEKAMEDTMGRASALTGGYGSTYAQTAGQQAYQSYLEKLSDILPELQQNAYQRYKQQGDALLEQYKLLQGQEDDAYERWRNAVTDWQKQLSGAREQYNTLHSADLKNYQLLLDYYMNKAAQELKYSGN